MSRFHLLVTTSLCMMCVYHDDWQLADSVLPMPFLRYVKFNRSYLEAYNIIREITGIGEGNGAWVGFHDGFQGLATWSGFMSGADRISMDQHNYLGFSTPSNDSIGYQATKPCVYWAMNYNNSMTNFGLSYSGEFSLAVNDCGVYLNNVGNGARFDGTYIAPGSTTPTFEAVGDCTTWNDWPSWDQDRKEGLVQVAYAHMDATQNWFMWTWKIGNSIKTGFAPNPMWHMKRECIDLSRTIL